MFDDKERGKYLKELRIKRGLKQSELAALVHYSFKNVSKWETGKSFPKDPETLNSLAKILNVSLDELIYGKEIEYKRNDKKDLIIVLIILFIICFIILLINIFIKDLYYTCIYNNQIKKTCMYIYRDIDIYKFKLYEIKSRNKSVEFISMHYIENEDKKLIFEGNDLEYKIRDFNYYNEYNFSSVVNNNCYIIFTYDDNTEEIIHFKFKKVI